MTQTISRPHSVRKKSPLIPRTYRLGLMGLGTVGQSLCRLIEEQRSALSDRHKVDLRITRVLVRNLHRSRINCPAGALLTDDPATFISGDYDAVVECMGGIEAAGSLTSALLEREVPVVTANKALLADRGEALQALAEQNRSVLRFEASVAAGIPIISLLDHALQSFQVSRLSAILNGTSNYILSCMDQEGVPYGEALQQARRLGYAEADPHLDVTGLDAAQKLLVLARTLGRRLPLSQIDVTGIERVATQDLARARAFGYLLKPLAVAECHGSATRGYVGPALVPEGHPLGSVWEVTNAVQLVGEPLGSLFLSGPGAGGLPTAASIVDDIIALALTTRGSVKRRDPVSLSEPGRSREPALHRWFLAVTPGKKPAPVRNTLEFLASSGVVFRQLREFDKATKPTFAGITSELSTDRMVHLERALTSTGRVDRFCAYRVLDTSDREGDQ